MKYRIKFEITDGTEGNNQLFKDKYPGGLECDGFCLLATRGDDKASIVIHDMSIANIAEHIAADDDGKLLYAGLIGKAIRDGRKYVDKRAGIKALAAILGRGEYDED